MVAVKGSGHATPVQIVQQFHTPSYGIAANEAAEFIEVYWYPEGGSS